MFNDSVENVHNFAENWPAKHAKHAKKPEPRTPVLSLLRLPLTSPLKPAFPADLHSAFFSVFRVFSGKFNCGS